MPDLFIVMNRMELERVINYARSQGAKRAKIVKAINYDLLINGKTLESYSKENGKWYPDFVEYISLSTSYGVISILISPTIWKDYDDILVYKMLIDNHLACDLEFDPLFIKPRPLMSFLERKYLIDMDKPHNSPIIAHTFSEFNTLLETLLNINEITVLKNAYLKISIYSKDSIDTADQFIGEDEVTNKRVVAYFKYPHIFHIEGDKGLFNIYLSEEINLEDALNLLEQKNVDTILKDFEDRDQDLLLYLLEKRELKLTPNH